LGVLNIRSYGTTDTGRVREKNEDDFLIDDERYLYIVADGMGGHAGGGFASSNAVRLVHEELIRLEQTQDTTQPLMGGAGKTLIQIRLEHAIKFANREIFNLSLKESSLRGMGTTLTALQFDNECANLAHVGDSRTYLIQDGEMKQLTRDHSYVQEQVDAGLITPEEARTHPLKNIITRSMGHERELQVDLLKFEYKPQDRFLLCSDGLTNMLSDQDLLALVQEMDIDPAAHEMVKQANEKGGQDNITVVIVSLE